MHTTLRAVMGKDKKTTDAQIVFRSETPHKIELESIASTLDTGYGDLLRELLIDHLPELRKRADEKMAERERLADGISPEVLERELVALHRRLMRRTAISLEPHNLLGPESKALWVFLGFLWGSHVTDEDRNRAKAFAQSLLR